MCFLWVSRPLKVCLCPYLPAHPLDISTCLYIVQHPAEVCVCLLTHHNHYSVRRVKVLSAFSRRVASSVRFLSWRRVFLPGNAKSLLEGDLQKKGNLRDMFISMVRSISAGPVVIVLVVLDILSWPPCVRTHTLCFCILELLQIIWRTSRQILPRQPTMSF